MRKAICFCCFIIIFITGCSKTEKQKVPDKVKNKISSSTESISFNLSEQDVSPEEMWDTILINGEHVKLPFCINDIGEGFETTEINHHNNVLVGKLKYYGKIVAVFGESCSNVDEVINKPLASINFVASDLEEIDKNIWPISINGVTIGSYIDDVRQKLSFFQEDNDGYNRFLYENDEYRIKVIITNKQVYEIDLNIKND